VCSSGGGWVCSGGGGWVWSGGGGWVCSGGGGGWVCSFEGRGRGWPCCSSAAPRRHGMRYEGVCVRTTSSSGHNCVGSVHEAAGQGVGREVIGARGGEGEGLALGRHGSSTRVLHVGLCRWARTRRWGCRSFAAIVCGVGAFHALREGKVSGISSTAFAGNTTTTIASSASSSSTCLAHTPSLLLEATLCSFLLPQQCSQLPHCAGSNRTKQPNREGQIGQISSHMSYLS
jgi:hypothetical protein